MTNDDPSGAVDNEFDDAATDAEESLQKNIAKFPAGIKPGDIVIDLVEGRPLYVRERKGTAIDVFEREAFDLTTYKAHPWLPIGPHDDVFECIFLPTKPSKIPSEKKTQTYSYPRGRLARVPVEWLYGSDTHRHVDLTIDVFVDLVESLVDRDAPDVVFEHVAEAIVHDFEPEAGDVVMPEMPKRDPEDDAEPQGSTSEEGEEPGDEDGLDDFDDFDGDE